MTSVSFAHVGSKTNLSHGVPRNSNPLADTVYCLQTRVNLWHFIILNLMSTSWKLIACWSTLAQNPVELTTPNCFIPPEFVLVLSIGSWTSGSEKVSFLLPHNRPIWVPLLLCHSGWFQVDDHLNNSSSPLPSLMISSCQRHLLEQIEYTHRHACSNCALVLLSSFSEEYFVQNANRWSLILFIYEQKAIWVIPTSSRPTKFLNNNSQVAHTTYPENVIHMRAVCSHLIRFGGN